MALCGKSVDIIQELHCLLEYLISELRVDKY